MIHPKVKGATIGCAIVTIAIAIAKHFGAAAPDPELHGALQVLGAFLGGYIVPSTTVRKGTSMKAPFNLDLGSLVSDGSIAIGDVLSLLQGQSVTIPIEIPNESTPAFEGYELTGSTSGSIVLQLKKVAADGSAPAAEHAPEASQPARAPAPDGPVLNNQGEVVKPTPAHS